MNDRITTELNTVTIENVNFAVVTQIYRKRDGTYAISTAIAP